MPGSFRCSPPARLFPPLPRASRRWGILPCGGWWALLLLAGLARVQAQAPAYTILHSFAAPGTASTNADGIHPYAAPIQGSDGLFYGTTFTGGAGGTGTVYACTPDGTLTTLHNFGAVTGSTTNPDGAVPEAGLVQGSDGRFYGPAAGGGPLGGGAVFALTPAGVFTDLYDFTNSDPSEGGKPDRTPYRPAAALVQGGDGRFYGTAEDGGAGNVGTVFALAPGAAPVFLHDFTGSLVADPSGTGDGADVVAGLTQGTDGRLYGTTKYGGASGDGAVFAMTLDGTLTILHSFGGPNGVDTVPTTALTLGGDGRLYGTTSAATDGSDYGSVFAVTPAGTLTTLYRFSLPDSQGFNADGALPYSALVLGEDGRFYGATGRGGAYGVGTVFALTPAGVLTTLHSFGAPGDGVLPTGVTFGDDGNLYGATYEGGANGEGSLFRLDTAPFFPGRLSLDPAATASEHAGSVVLTVRRGFGSGGTASVRYATTDGTALAGTDYQARSGTLTWADGDATPRTVTVPLVDRHLYQDGTRAFSLTLAGATGATLTGATAGVTILEDDILLPPVVADTPFPAAQEAVAFSYRIAATNPSTSYAATGLPAGLGLDAATGLISGAPTVAGTFPVTLSATNASGVGKVTLALAVAPPGVTLTASVPTVTAGIGAVGTFSLTLAQAQDHDVFVNLTIKGSAENGTDYVLLKTQKKIKAGKTTKPVKVVPLGDGAGPGGHRTVVLLLEPGDGYTVGTTGKVKVKIFGQ